MKHVNFQCISELTWTHDPYLEDVDLTEFYKTKTAQYVDEYTIVSVYFMYQPNDSFTGTFWCNVDTDTKAITFNIRGKRLTSRSFFTSFSLPTLPNNRFGADHCGGNYWWFPLALYSNNPGVLRCETPQEVYRRGRGTQK